METSAVAVVVAVRPMAVAAARCQLQHQAAVQPAVTLVAVVAADCFKVVCSKEACSAVLAATLVVAAVAELLLATAVAVLLQLLR